MEKRNALIAGALLIVIGLFLLGGRILPDYLNFFSGEFIIIGIGLIFLLFAIFTRRGGLAVPGMIISGVGGILYYQNTSGDWSSWSYLWTLIPGFVGLGVILAGLLSREKPHFDSGGLVLVVISALGFLLFGGAFGLNWDITQYWPFLLIGAGLIVLVSAFFHRK